MKKVGVIVLSFALRAGREPNPCNVRLSRATERVVRWMNQYGIQAVVIPQWETEIDLHIPVAHVVCKHRNPGSYLDSDEVILQAKEWAEVNEPDVKEWVIVANLWIHYQGAVAIARRYGLKIMRIPILTFVRLIGWIGFDKKSDQWQTKGPIRAFVYTVGRVFFSRFGQSGQPT